MLLAQILLSSRSALRQLSVTSSSTHKQIGPFWCWFLGLCTFWDSVCLSNELSCEAGSFSCHLTPTGFFSQRFWGFISPHGNPGLHSLFSFPVVPPCLYARECGTIHCASLQLTRSPSCNLAISPLCPSCPCLPLLPVWMNVSFCWLSDFHTVWFSVSSVFCFFFKFVVVLLVVWGGTVYLPMPPSWLEVEFSYGILFFFIILWRKHLPKAHKTKTTKKKV